MKGNYYKLFLYRNFQQNHRHLIAKIGRNVLYTLKYISLKSFRSKFFPGMILY